MKIKAYSTLNHEKNEEFHETLPWNS